MRTFCLFLALFLIQSSHSFGRDVVLSDDAQTSDISACYELYVEMQLQDEVSYEAFEQAFLGHNKIKAQNKDVLTLIDFSKPSTEERLYILDMKGKSILRSSLVSHGKKSGGNYATSFSNKKGSHKSSLGFYLTGDTYEGRNGYSLVLNGLERGINDRAKARSIVVHGAAYCDPSEIASSGRIGRSFGCPAVPEDVNQEIIDAIKGGTILFIYAGDASYTQKSSILSSK